MQRLLLKHLIVRDHHLPLALCSGGRLEPDMLSSRGCDLLLRVIHISLPLLLGMQSVFGVDLELVPIRPHLIKIRGPCRALYWKMLTSYWVAFRFAFRIRGAITVLFFVKNLTFLGSHSFKVRFFDLLMLVRENVKFMENQQLEIRFVIREEKTKV